MNITNDGILINLYDNSRFTWNNYKNKLAFTLLFHNNTYINILLHSDIVYTINIPMLGQCTSDLTPINTPNMNIQQGDTVTLTYLDNIVHINVNGIVSQFTLQSIISQFTLHIPSPQIVVCMHDYADISIDINNMIYQVYDKTLVSSDIDISSNLPILEYIPINVNYAFDSIYVNTHIPSISYANIPTYTNTYNYMHNVYNIVNNIDFSTASNLLILETNINNIISKINDISTNYSILHASHSRFINEVIAANEILHNIDDQVISLNIDNIIDELTLVNNQLYSIDYNELNNTYVNKISDINRLHTYNNIIDIPYIPTHDQLNVFDDMIASYKHDFSIIYNNIDTSK